ncbi:MAG: HAD family hydrolase [Candidatus Heimdallarchaeota archaeon]
MIKCISFDFDRTLAHVKPHTHHLVPKLLAEKGIHVSIEEFQQKCAELRQNIPIHLQDHYLRFGCLSKELRDNFLKEYNKARIDLLELDGDQKEIEILKEWLTNQIYVQQKKILYDDVVSMIKKLSNLGLKQYILSGNHSDGIVQLLKESNILDYFEEIITVDKYNAKKIANFKILLEHSNFSPDKILHIGDDLKTDGYGPRGFQIKSIIIRRADQLVFLPKHDESFQSITKLDELTRFLG